MTEIRIPIAQGYPVLIGPGLLEQAGELLRSLIPGRFAAIVTDDVVAPLYLERLKDSLAREDIRSVECVIPHGEEHKTLNTVAQMLSHFAGKGLTRSDRVIALGGGVVGDMAGFAAAIFLRGISFVQVPTTLLSAVDASVGGKTAVDLPEGKNLAGAFHQPLGVLCDVETFATLPRSRIADGMAEAIKMGVLFDRAYFDSLSHGAPSNLTGVVARSVELKRDIVVRDEFDRGERALLNLGHTFGHAIEACTDFSLSHGHAVAIGTVMAARASEKLNLAEEPLVEPIRAAMLASGLPVGTDIPSQRLLARMAGDKKRAGDEITLILPVRIGQALRRTVPVGALAEILEAAR